MRTTKFMASQTGAGLWTLVVALGVCAGGGCADDGDPDGPRDAIALGPAPDAATGPDAKADGLSIGLDAAGARDAPSATDALVNPADAGYMDAASCTLTYAAGHGDLFARYDELSGELSLHVHSHLKYPEPSGEAPLHDPASVCIVVPRSSRDAVAQQGGRPALEAFAPVGVDAGEAFWILESRNLGAAQPFLGVSTEGVPPGVFVDPLRFELDVEGPPGAHMAVYQLPFLPRFLVSTTQPNSTVTGAQAIEMAAGGHDHYNWAFTRPGNYAVRTVVKGRKGGTLVKSATATFHFRVADM